jgi:hypothetical protein
MPVVIPVTGFTEQRARNLPQVRFGQDGFSVGEDDIDRRAIPHVPDKERATMLVIKVGREHRHVGRLSGPSRRLSRRLGTVQRGPGGTLVPLKRHHGHHEGDDRDDKLPDTYEFLPAAQATPGSRTPPNPVFSKGAARRTGTPEHLDPPVMDRPMIP